MSLCTNCRGTVCTCPKYVTATYTHTFSVIGALTPPQQWCGVHHPHGTHRFGAPNGMLADCPGSNCNCGADTGSEQ